MPIVEINILILFIVFASGVAGFGFWLMSREGQTIFPALILFASASIFMFVFVTTEQINMGSIPLSIDSNGVITWGQDLVDFTDFKYYFLAVTAFLSLMGALGAQMHKSQGKGEYIDTL